MGWRRSAADGVGDGHTLTPVPLVVTISTGAGYAIGARDGHALLMRCERVRTAPLSVRWNYAGSDFGTAAHRGPTWFATLD